MNDRMVLKATLLCMKRSILSYNNGICSILYLVLFYCCCFVLAAAAAATAIITSPLLLLSLLLYRTLLPWLLLMLLYCTRSSLYFRRTYCSFALYHYPYFCRPDPIRSDPIRSIRVK